MLSAAAAKGTTATDDPNDSLQLRVRADPGGDGRAKTRLRYNRSGEGAEGTDLRGNNAGYHGGIGDRCASAADHAAQKTPVSRPRRYCHARCNVYDASNANADGHAPGVGADSRTNTGDVWGSST